MPPPKLIFVTSLAAGILLVFTLVSRLQATTGPLLERVGRTEHQPVGAKANLRFRLDSAEKVWKQSVYDRQKMLSEVGPDREFPDGYIYPYNVWDFARPSFFCPHDLERVGTLGDGGKVVCGMSRYEQECPPVDPETPVENPLVIYSFGVSTDSSFEAQMLKRTNAEIWGYDFSVDEWGPEIKPSQKDRAHFHRAAIGKTTDESKYPPKYSVQDLMEANNHTWVDIIKMDIEGAEFDALESMVSHFSRDTTADGTPPTLPFGQLLLELHFIGDGADFRIPKNLNSWMEWWAGLESLGLRPVNNEDNWIGDVFPGKPRFMEYTLINAVDGENKLLL